MAHILYILLRGWLIAGVICLLLYWIHGRNKRLPGYLRIRSVAEAIIALLIWPLMLLAILDGKDKHDPSQH